MLPCTVILSSKINPQHPRIILLALYTLSCKMQIINSSCHNDFAWYVRGVWLLLLIITPLFSPCSLQCHNSLCLAVRWAMFLSVWQLAMPWCFLLGSWQGHDAVCLTAGSVLILFFLAAGSVLKLSVWQLAVSWNCLSGSWQCLDTVCLAPVVPWLCLGRKPAETVFCLLNSMQCHDTVCCWQPIVRCYNGVETVNAEAYNSIVLLPV
jgi:hypothetical protein